MAPYASSGGVILPKTTLTFSAGASVCDVLEAACKKYSVELDTTYDSVYASTYVQSIGGICEKDYGSGSGWTYTVNGTFASTSCNAYKLKSGDTVAWNYVGN